MLIFDRIYTVYGSFTKDKMEEFMSVFKLRTAKNKSTGITLIALVITIIVLLILAGISISMLSGDNRYYK